MPQDSPCCGPVSRRLELFLNLGFGVDRGTYLRLSSWPLGLQKMPHAACYGPVIVKSCARGEAFRADNIDVGYGLRPL